MTTRKTGLRLSRETVRELGGDALDQAAGGTLVRTLLGCGGTLVNCGDTVTSCTPGCTCPYTPACHSSPNCQ
ncbi:MAG TPA: hypothetical protein VG245_08260 [Candidatus Dormibacteraeota bacterium]|jgi:hypothetical protein|nr:hypothetical protein [Candidatus Dormibacteraeota bacterium]